MMRQDAVEQRCCDDRADETDEQECGSHEAGCVVRVSVWALRRYSVLNTINQRQDELAVEQLRL